MFEEKQKIPNIETTSSINPIETNGRLISPILEDRVNLYETFVPDMWNDFLRTESDGLVSQNKARKLAEFYLLKTASKLQNNPVDLQLFNSRFNQMGRELFGEPNLNYVSDIARSELRELDVKSSDPLVVDIYKKLLLNETRDEHLNNLEVFTEFKTALLENFSLFNEIFEELPNPPYTPELVRQIFKKIIARLAQDDNDWSGWNITNNNFNTMIGVNPDTKEIDIPDGREDINEKNELVGLVFHEVFNHATRAVNGYKKKDELMYKGFPDYLEFEEGLAIFFEYLVTGKIPDKIKDRYIDITLATGAKDNIILSRRELIDFAIRREKSRDLVRAKLSDSNNIESKVINHINRIFRGGTGQSIRDKNGQIISQAVFNKDLVYYSGFGKVTKFIFNQLSSGAEPYKLIDFLLSCKFDPTNAEHLKYIKDNYSIELKASVR